MALILLAEDERDIREMVTLSLRFHNIDSHAVSNGREALNAACGSTFDLILLDMNMPEMDGLQAARAIRQASQNVQTPILFLSGDDKLSSVPVENSRLLMKPFAISDLVTTIKSLLN